MSGKQLRAGMQVFEADGRPLGTIESVRGDTVTVGGHRIPKGEIAHVEPGCAYLKETPARRLPRPRASETRQAASRSTTSAPAIDRRPRGRLFGAVTPAPAGDADEREMTDEALVMPLAEEHLHVEKRRAELGEVEVRKVVVEEEETVPVELAYDEVVVEVRDVAERPLPPDADLFHEGTIRIPIHGEEALIYKDPVVTGEVVIAKGRATQRRQITETVRAERVVVDE
jgi:uncharacterized protein (TIGR02271 family)